MHDNERAGTALTFCTPVRSSEDLWLCNDTVQFRDYSWPGLLPWDALSESESLASRVSVHDRSHTTQAYTNEDRKLIKQVNNKFRNIKHGKEGKNISTAGVKKGKVHPCTGTEALYRPCGL